MGRGLQKDNTVLLSFCFADGEGAEGGSEQLATLSSILFFLFLPLLNISLWSKWSFLIPKRQAWVYQTPIDDSGSFYVTKKKVNWAYIMMVLNGKLERATEGCKARFVDKTETPGLYWLLWYDPCPSTTANMGQINRSFGHKEYS